MDATLLLVANIVILFWLTLLVAVPLSMIVMFLREIVRARREDR